MTKFMVIGDLHIQLSTPQHRLTPVQEALTAKFMEIGDICSKHQVDFVTITGDIFNSGQVNNNTLLFAAKLLENIKCPIYTVPGNHDLFNWNIKTYYRTSLYLLSLIVENLIVITSPKQAFKVGKMPNEVCLSGQHFCDEIDKDGFGYSRDSEANLPSDCFNVHLVHGMLLEHKPPFNTYTLVKDVKTNCDMVVTGHDHIGYGTLKYNGVTYCNPGSILRTSASNAEISRKIKVSICTIKYKTATMEDVILQSAFPGNEVLDRTKIDETRERNYAMDEFSTLLKSKYDGKVERIDIFSIIQKIAELEFIEPRIVDIAISKLKQKM